jgi:hypothetical protein
VVQTTDYRLCSHELITTYYPDPDSPLQPRAHLLRTALRHHGDCQHARRRRVWREMVSSNTLSSLSLSRCICFSLSLSCFCFSSSSSTSLPPSTNQVQRRPAGQAPELPDRLPVRR